jgi:hypothetical protein
MRLQDAITRNRARQAQKRAGVPTERKEERLRAYTVNVLTNPPVYMIELGLAPPPHHETRTIYGTSLADAKKRAGIE